MAPRDRWIGWSEQERARNLVFLVHNSRFLILPWVRGRGLASKDSGRVRAPVAWGLGAALRLPAAAAGDAGRQPAVRRRLLPGGQVTETIEVVGGTPLLEPNTSSLGTVMDTMKIQDLPLNGRNPMGLANLIPTVRGVGFFGGQVLSTWRTAAINIAGGQAVSNGWLIDGMANDKIGDAAGAMTFLTVEATQEFKVLTNNMSAEFGRSGGGIISVISKSGTNDFHGNLFEYLRLEDLNANDFFANRSGARRGPLTWNQFGGSLGGPIKKERAFFFFNWESYRERRCDIEKLEPLIIEPNREPTATFVRPTVGYQEGSPAMHVTPFAFVEQDREEYYRETHLQTIEFQIARLIVDQLTGAAAPVMGRKQRVLALQSRHQLFPQVFRYVDEYVRRKVNFQNCHPCELGLEKYVQRMVERLRDGIVPDESEGEAPLLPIINRYKPVGTTAEVDFKTTRPCHATVKSHVDQVVLDNLVWEASAAFRLEASSAVSFYARNDHLGLTIPYEYMGIDHAYEPDFLVRLANGVTGVVEIKGFEDDQTKAKHNAAKRWVEAVNNWGQLGVWAFHVFRNPQLLESEMKYLTQVLGRAS